MAAGPNHRFMAVSILLLLIQAFAGGCAWVVRPPLDDPAARRVVEIVAHNNAELQNYKGLAQVQIEYDHRKIRGRIACAAAAPNQMRVEWLNTLGQPLTSLAGDGKTITIVSHGDRKFYRFRQSQTALDAVVHIPIGIEEMLDILAGRPHLPRYAAAQMVQADEGGERVTLKNRWHGVVAVLAVDRRSKRVVSMKAYDGAGSWRYEVKWHEWKSYGAYVVPRRVEIVSPAGQRLTIAMDRFWPDADIGPQIFVLAPLEKV